MDPLDRVGGAARDLCERIDATLMSLGAPAGHPVWSLLRRVGATTATAVSHVAATRPDETRAAAAALRRVATGRRTALDALPGRLEGRGAAVEAYAARAGEIADDLGVTGHGGRLDATVDYLDAVAAWIDASRHALARELAVCLGSREAVTLRAAGFRWPAGSGWPPGVAGSDRAGPGGAAIVVAADLGTRVLRVIAAGVDEGWAVRSRFVGALAEHVPATTTVPDLRPGTHIDVR
jgi:hypothetical protein